MVKTPTKKQVSGPWDPELPLSFYHSMERPEIKHCVIFFKIEPAKPSKMHISVLLTPSFSTPPWSPETQNPHIDAKANWRNSKTFHSYELKFLYLKGLL